MAEYRCTHCDLVFEHDDGKLRCPNCLRQHGLEPARAAPPQNAVRAKSGKRRLLVGLLVLCVLGLLGGGGMLAFRLWTDLPAPGTLAILGPDLLKRGLRHRGVPDEDVDDPFSVSKQIRDLATSVEDSSPGGRAAALAERLADRMKGRVKLDLTGRSDSPVRTAAQLLDTLDVPEKSKKKTKKPVAATSFELAALAVAVMRAAGLQALLCQAHRVEAPLPTADVAGGIGRYLVAVYRSKDELGKKPVIVLDPTRATELPRWAGEGGDHRMRARVKGKPLPLDDLSAAAHLLALRGLRQGRVSPKEAYRLSGLALKAAAPSDTLLLIRATILTSAGGVKDAINAAQKALTLRDAPPQRTVLALALVSDGAVTKAVSHLEQAIRQDASYWPAHRALALVTAGERAHKHLEAGLKVAPKEPSLLLLKADRLLQQGQDEEAILLLRDLSTRVPSELVLVLLYQALVKADRSEEAKPIRSKLLAMAKDRKDREKMTRLLDAIVRAAGGDANSGADAEMPLTPVPKIPKLTLPDVSLTK